MKNKDSLIVSVYNFKDIDKISKDTKYINIDITNLNYDVITYFLEHGNTYKYTDIIDGVIGYTYVDFKTFEKAENLISMIYANMPNDLNEMEIARYLYVKLGKCLSYDINTDTNKNELYDLSLITEINNIWGSLTLGKVNDVTASKIYYYLCKRLNIDITLVTSEDNKRALTKMIINNQIMVTDLYEDIPYIQANMQTKCFSTYNDDILMDKRVKYIKNRYNNYYLDKVLKDIDYTQESCVWDILNNTKKVLNINFIKPLELGIIFKHIFEMYLPNYDVKINNLFLNNALKKHFLLISYRNDHYSYNYKKEEYVKVHDNDLLENINIGKIGLYLNEVIPNINN